MATKRKTEVIPLRKWILKGKEFDYIVVCPKCSQTKQIEEFQDLFFCQCCGLDVRALPTKAGQFTIWKQNLIPVFLWSDPIRTVVKRKPRIKKIMGKRKSFDE